MACGLHRRDDLARGNECTEGVDPPHGLKILGADLLDAAPYALACIVNERIDRAEFLMDRGERELDRQGIGGIAGNCEGERQLLRQRLESFLLACKQNDGVAFLREFEV